MRLERASQKSSISPITVFSISRARVQPNRKSWICSMNSRSGEVWLADLGLAAKTRPVIIVSREEREADGKNPFTKTEHKRVSSHSVRSKSPKR